MTDLTEDQRQQGALWAHDIRNEAFHKANEAAIAGANLALKTLLLINGGACVSLLTFVGTLKDKADVARTLGWFASGVALACFGFLLSYVTHYAMVTTISSWTARDEYPYFHVGPRARFWRAVKIGGHGLAIVAGLASLIAFIIGIFQVRHALISLG
jgi:hypothetical protein